MVWARVSMVLLVVAPAAVLAQPRSPNPPLVGATEVVRLVPPAGFVDDAIAADGDRVAYVVSDAATKAELHVLTLSTRAEQVVDIAGATLHPVALALVGPRVLVIGALDDGRQTAALVEPAATAGKGRIVYKLGPATHITMTTRDGRQRLTVHRATTSPTGTRHEVELVAIDSGRRLAAARPFELDAAGASKTLDFKVNHWSDGWTRAHGIKGGDWDRKENQRSPDTEATYDLMLARIVDRTPIADPFDQRRRFQALADSGGRLDFARFTWDSSAVLIWTAGKPRAIELDQPLATYDPKSLDATVSRDGSAWLALKVDPVNPDAVARKKTDPEYFDIFRLPPDGRATRKARILATSIRHRFGPFGDRFWLLERSPGSDRGGKSLTIYQLQ